MKIETKTASYWIEDGIIFAQSKNTKRTVENLSESHQLLKQITHGKRMPTLVYMCSSPMPDKETRDFSAQQIGKLYTAMAFVSSSHLGNFVMNLLFKFQKPSIPTKSFTNEKEALKWIKNHK